MPICRCSYYLWCLNKPINPLSHSQGFQCLDRDLVLLRRYKHTKRKVNNKCFLQIKGPHARTHARSHARTHARTHAHTHARTHARMNAVVVVVVSLFQMTLTLLYTWLYTVLYYIYRIFGAYGVFPHFPLPKKPHTQPVHR